MNPERYADDRDYASDMTTVLGTNANVFIRIFEIRRRFSQVRTSVNELETFLDKYNEGNMSHRVARNGLASVKELMRSLDRIEYYFPGLGEEVWFSGFQDDVHHAYWRIEDGRFNGVLESEDDALDGFAREVNRILGNVSDSTHTNPVNQLNRFFEHYGEGFYPGDAPEEYYNEVFEARDLFCLGYYSTGLFVLGRAVERALLKLGDARKITSVDGFRGSTAWDLAYFAERTEALHNIDKPDDSGKMISEKQYHWIQLLMKYRNQVAHDEYRAISKSDATRMMGQALELLSDLEELRIELDKMDDDQIHKREDVSVTP